MKPNYFGKSDFTIPLTFTKIYGWVYKVRIWKLFFSRKMYVASLKRLKILCLFFTGRHNFSTKREVVEQLQTLTQCLWIILLLNGTYSLWILSEENVARWLINKNKVGWIQSWVWTWIFRTSKWIWHEQKSQPGNKEKFQSKARATCIAFQR